MIWGAVWQSDYILLVTSIAAASVAQCVERRAFTPQDVQLAEEAEQDAAAGAALVALSSPKLELLLGSCFVLIPDAAVFPRTQANAASPLRLSPVLLRRQWAPIHRGCPFSHPVIQASMPVIRSYKSSVHSWCSDHIQPSGARYAARAAQVRRRCVRMRAFRNCYRAPLSPQTRADWDNKVIKCKKGSVPQKQWAKRSSFHSRTLWFLIRKNIKVTVSSVIFVHSQMLI